MLGGKSWDLFLSPQGPTQRRPSSPPGYPGGPQGFFGLGKIPAKPLSGRVWGKTWYTRRVPWYHRNHFPPKTSWENSWGINPSAKLCFSDPLLGVQKGRWAFGIPDPDLGFQKWSPGLKISKLRIERQCRIHWSWLQKGPYVASYGP